MAPHRSFTWFDLFYLYACAGRGQAYQSLEWLIAPSLSTLASFWKRLAANFNSNPGIGRNVKEITSQSGSVTRTLTYDLNGSITSDGGTRTFEWDAATRLVAINYTGFTTHSELICDGLSRVAKIVEKTGSTINSTRKFVWSGQEKIEFRDATDAVTQRNFAHGQYVGTTAYFYARDHLGRANAPRGSRGRQCFDPRHRRHRSREIAVSHDYVFESAQCARPRSAAKSGRRFRV
jgi:YD repeat-containing protein